MANTDKNIVITPNTGSTTSDPNIVFTGSGNDNITLSVKPDNSGTLDFSGSNGSLLSISNGSSTNAFSVYNNSGLELLSGDQNGVFQLKNNSSLKGASAGSIYAPGMIIQTTTIQLHEKQSYSAPPGTTGTAILGLRASITPKFANSKIILQYNLNGECSHDHVFRLTRNGTMIGQNTIDSGRWSGWGTQSLGNWDQGSTPNTAHMVYVDTPNTTSLCQYDILISSSGGSTHTLWLNRSIASAGQDGYEVGISHVVIQEVAQ